MGYKWKPSKSKKREFAIRMQDDSERQAYEARKAAKRGYANFKDKDFTPTEMQYKVAVNILNSECSHIVKDACDQVMYGFSCQEKIPHSYIHIVNAIQRGEKLTTDIDF